MQLTKVDTGEYITKDGRFKVERSWHYTYCDGEHPVRIPKEARFEIRNAIGREAEYEVQNKYGREAFHAVRMGQKGYMCDGNDEHIRHHWIIWDVEADDYEGGHGVNDYETKKEAVEYLAEKYYGEESERTRRFREAMEGIT